MAASTQNESVHVFGQGSTPMPGAVLVFSGTAPQLRAFSVGSEPLTVDRDLMNLPDGRVSRRHAHLRFDGAGWTVRDLGSKNGTSVHGKKLDREAEGRAASGQVVRTGASLFVLYDDVRRFLTGGVVSTEPWVIGPTLKAELDRVTLAARSGRTVLLGGENGAGKEVAARTYHEATGKKGPYHAVNCAGIDKPVAEQLMFGVVKGAHSEAKADKPGHVQAAEGGTLFLDEVGELDLEVQAKLLRMIENREVLPLGATASRKVDVRIIAATNRDLRRAVEGGTFRQDLFYRLAQVEAHVPALRERLEEVPYLIDAALREEAVRTAHVSLVEAALMRPWPGNVRELSSQVKLAASTAQAAGDDAVRDHHLSAEAGLGPERAAPRRAVITAAAVPAAAVAPVGAGAGVESAAETADISREQLAAALEGNAWVVSEVQRVLGIKHRNTLVRLMKKHGLKRPGAGDDDEG
ncbi:MAG: sigma-54-dependent Fis family transcriptional regulator [Archangiaceae bacterium]|nr:sigma-54-dependent Fis family transcriptional regulator [Archangiaceae bacterium]